MRPIPPKLKKDLLSDPYYKTCARKGHLGHECGGRITFEHALIYAGKQLNEKFAIIPLCAKAHSVDRFQDGGDLNKEINTWISLNLATLDELNAISKVIPYEREKSRLNAKYGVYQRPSLPVFQGINY